MNRRTLIKTGGMALVALVAVGFSQSAFTRGQEGAAGDAPATAVTADGLVYVSGTVGAAADGTVTGDIKTQTARALDNIAAALEAENSTLARAASVTVSLRSVGDFAAMNEVFREYWPADPPARTTIVMDGPLTAPGALVEIAAVAVPAGGERVVVLPAGWMRPGSPYSYGIRSGSTLFMAGLINRNGVDGTPVPGDISAQTTTVMTNGAAVLAAAGMTLADVVASRVFLADAGDFQAMNAVYRTFWESAPPTRATVKAGMPAPDALLEVTMIAVKDASRAAVIPPNADGSPGRPGANLSSGIQVGSRLYVAGITGSTQDTAGDVTAQTAEALARIERVLRAAGYNWSDVVDETAFLPDMTRLSDVHAAESGVLSGTRTRTVLGTPLMGSAALIEIMLTAVK